MARVERISANVESLTSVSPLSILHNVAVVIPVGEYRPREQGLRLQDIGERRPTRAVGEYRPREQGLRLSQPRGLELHSVNASVSIVQENKD